MSTLAIIKPDAVSSPWLVAAPPAEESKEGDAGEESEGKASAPAPIRLSEDKAEAIELKLLAAGFEILQKKRLASAPPAPAPPRGARRLPLPSFARRL